jgi:hypothetical protein
MTTSASSPSNSDPRRRFSLLLEIGMVAVALAIGAAFYGSIWSEPAEREVRAAAAPAPAPAHS